ncbi:MAG: glutamine-hydrolyzing carbamoyl-phosphate synthase small subunit [Acidimicrobiia bacterium]|nr:glutamine-hydrolyzing carbamoyl-phosphate synthase small subunit [Acidimicrobiia bacterium]MYC58382.1 glutamine-hydrolyzing carbamoyl-phosphate synthase small subunit [Acidimicrobiia bacterium]MYG94141.1 glutamine-hydrolyzing carbamoyl-phosphate synthase small subunit [Acidimicrobiia bacterium]MYI30512.1 glutamine-hydrolyzing carbamoyl-phosphate synthase small subunit [Acidimicrobiia bacterium]
MIRAAALVLSDGTLFEGEAIGAEPSNGITSGEVVFNTVLTGYQEVITDPSYAGQIITFTYPHIGNYGVSAADHESRQPFCRGVIVREMARHRSSWRSSGDLDVFLQEQNIAGLAGVDTRRLTNHIREAGAMSGAFGTATESELRAAAAAEPGTDGIDLVATVTRSFPEHFASTRADKRPPHRVVAIDFGLKATIMHHLRAIADVELVPASTTAADVLARQPDGVFLSNGPGDPTAVVGAVQTIANLLGEVPIFGICLGHQLLAAALGAQTYKLPFGHHGGNHPVRNLATGAVEITSQNHNFCVVEASIHGADITHINLNDHTVEGLRCREVPAFSVQYHPEAGPGPHDSRYLFHQFDQLMDC